jgi:hypothetical protein
MDLHPRRNHRDQYPRCHSALSAVSAGDLKRRDDALGGNPVSRVIVDHCSCSWGLDENLSLYRHIDKTLAGEDEKLPAERLTIQWCISSEALDLNNHAFGGTGADDMARSTTTCLLAIVAAIRASVGETISISATTSSSIGGIEQSMAAMKVPG